MPGSKDETSYYSLSALEPASQRNYARSLHKLLFNIIRSALSSWPVTSPKYPSLTSDQLVRATLLHAALQGGDSERIGASLFEFCFSIFGHKRDHKAKDSSNSKFFSCVICYLVYSSVNSNGSFRAASQITQTIAKLTYCIRITMLYKMVQIAEDGERDLYE